MVRSALVKDIQPTYEAAVRLRTYATELQAKNEDVDIDSHLRALFATLKAVLAYDATEEDRLEFVRAAVGFSRAVSPSSPHARRSTVSEPPPTETKEEATMLPPLADYCEDALPIMPFVMRAVEAAEQAGHAKRRTFFVTMPSRDDTKDLYKPERQSARPEMEDSSRNRTSSHGQLSYPARVVAPPRPGSTTSISSTLLPRSSSHAGSPRASNTAGSPRSGSSITVSPSQTLRESDAPAPLSRNGVRMPVCRPRALSEAPPMLTAKQAAQQCTRAQLVSMSRKGLWRDYYFVLRGADLYVFKELHSSKPTILTRIDSCTELDFKRTDNCNALKIRTLTHKLVIRTEQANDILSWRAVLERAKGGSEIRLQRVASMSGMRNLIQK